MKKSLKRQNLKDVESPYKRVNAMNTEIKNIANLKLGLGGSDLVFSLLVGVIFIGRTVVASKKMSKCM